MFLICPMCVGGFSARLYVRALVSSCVISFPDVYSKTVRLKNLRPDIQHTLERGHSTIDFLVAISDFEVTNVIGLFPEVFSISISISNFVQLIFVVGDMKCSAGII